MNNSVSHENARNNIRQQARLARCSLSEQQQMQYADKLLTQLTRLEKIQQANNIAITLAFDGEIQTMPFIKWCWKNEKQVYLPVLHPFSKGNLLFIHFTSNTEMATNQYGILEPKLNLQLVCPLNQLDIIFTPLVAFDNQGNRIGMGGGYYDRTLAPWFTEKTGPYPIGLAHDCQRVNKLPIEPWDVPLPEIITPTQQYLFTANN